MSYTKTTWVDDNAPAINASNLNKIEQGIFDVHKMIVADGQIKFPATQVPSADPNTLDDYEEGTFTPVVVGSTTTGVGTYSRQVGRYTKIGNTVTLSIDITLTAHTGTGQMIITGLPFSFVVSGVQLFINSVPLPVDSCFNFVVSGDTIIARSATGSNGNIPVPISTTARMAISLSSLVA